MKKIIKLFLLVSLISSIFCMQVAIAEDSALIACDMGKTIEDITHQLSEDLSENFQPSPILLLIGGFPGAGKTTLIHALKNSYDVAVISWNAIRQALLDRRIKDSPPTDWGLIIKAVHQNLLRTCLQRHVNVVIDANAYANNIKATEDFLRAEEPLGQEYNIIKICLNPPIETLFDRVRARVQKEGVHQGTESDLRRDLNSLKKKIDLNDYALVIDTEKVPFDIEWNVVDAFLKKHLANSP